MVEIAVVLKILAMLINLWLLVLTCKIGFLAIIYDSDVNLIKLRNKKQSERKKAYMYMFGVPIICLFYTVIGLIVFATIPFSLKGQSAMWILIGDIVVMLFGVYLIVLFKRIFKYLTQ
ncbi:hypothetical protein [Staphylococcus warneri]|uniref:hypothetical protein n=1 Tax=Staphylococcus warneri TaxID=1292 RepID=UPI001A8C25E2|nr:hypothetical protein [Staphylococcus warneri]MBO0377059.1 hypothetical protein [Staphylococcus warneri]